MRRVLATAVVPLAAAIGISMSMMATPVNAQVSTQVVEALAPRPNVLTIMLDDANLNYNQVSWKQMLPIAAGFFADGGREFTNAYANIPSCCPSRSNFFTGLHTQNNGVDSQGKGYLLNPDAMLQSYLQRDGYRTLMMGKYLNLFSSPPPGFDDYTTIMGTKAYNDYTVLDDGVKRAETRYITTFQGEKSRELLFETEVDDAQPWHLNLSFIAPHMHGNMADPDNPPVEVSGRCYYPSEADRTDKPPFVQNMYVKESVSNWICNRSVQALASVDRQVGLILDQLRLSGELDNTIVLLVSDNGIQVGAQNLSRKWVAYDQSVRVPLLMKGPGVVPGIDKRLVGIVDILPTLLQLTGIPPRTDLPPIDGVSLQSTYSRPYMLLQYHQDRYTPSNMGVIPTWWALVYPNGSKYIRSTKPDSPATTIWREYYQSDLKDPLEATNVLPGGKPNTVKGNGLPYTPQLDGLLNVQRTCAGHVTQGGSCR